MTARYFVDSNILIYLYDHSFPEKRAKAIETIGLLIRHPDSMVISTQVLSELGNVATRKLKISPPDVEVEVERFSQFVAFGTDIELVLESLHLMGVASISFFDAMIVASAKRAHCKVLLTEDLNDGQVIEGVKIVNPLKLENASFLAASLEG